MFKRLFAVPSKMNAITFAVVCMYTVSYSIEGAILPHSFQRDDNAVLKEQVHKSFYLLYLKSFFYS